jgi:uncharacterized protein (DUF1501 family)
MTWDISRRVFLRGAGLAALGVGFHPSSLLVRAAEAAGAGDEVLVSLFLRGGADGLNMVAPYGDPQYYAIRQTIGLGRPGQAGGLLRLDDTFGLHPALAPLKPIFDEGRLAVLHAVGNYSLSRSHFDAQDFMETGTPGVKGTTSGWLDRSLADIPGRDITQGVAFSAQVPRSYIGGEPVLVAQSLTSFDFRARNWRDEAERLLHAMYDGNPTPVGKTGRETMAAVNVLLRTPEVNAAPANGAAYPNAFVGTSLRQAAGLIKARLGTRTIFVNVTGGFDTHANEIAANQNDYTNLGLALAAFDRDLGPLMDKVVVMVNTEFGRTAAENGSAGTDHGSGFAMLYLGGRVRGSRVHGRWPGLAKSQLYQERDLAVTTDFRDAFAEAAVRHLGVTDASALFPGYTPQSLPGVIA